MMIHMQEGDLIVFLAQYEEYSVQQVKHLGYVKQPERRRHLQK